MVTVPTGGYTAPKGWIRGRPKDEFYRKPVAIRPGLTDPSGRPIQPRVPRRPPDPLGGRDFRDLNRQERAEVIKQRYQLSQTERMRRYNDARQRVMDRFRNDPIKLRQELSKLNVQIRQSDTVEKFRAGLVNANALRKVGIPPRDIRGITFQRRMSVMPESPRKLDMMLNFQIRQMNVDLRERIKRMQAQGATRQEIQRLKISYFNQVARLRQNIAKAKADLQTDRRRRLSAIMGPR